MKTLKIDGRQVVLWEAGRSYRWGMSSSCILWILLTATARYRGQQMIVFQISLAWSTRPQYPLPWRRYEMTKTPVVWVLRCLFGGSCVFGSTSTLSNSSVSSYLRLVRLPYDRCQCYPFCTLPRVVCGCGWLYATLKTMMMILSSFTAGSYVASMSPLT